MNKYFFRLFLVGIIITFLFPAGNVIAQANPASGPVYIVQEGDSLWDIAYRFHVSQQDLAAANGITNYNQISTGQNLIIPGLEGIEGVLTTENISFGETLVSLSRRYHLSTDVLERLNHITSPNELYTGYSFVVLEDNASLQTGQRASLGKGESLLELSVRSNSSPWVVLADNQLESSSEFVPNDIVRIPGSEDNGPGGLPSTITSVNINRMMQGETAELQVEGASGGTLQGSLMSHPLIFFSASDQLQVALQGINAMAAPGLYSLEIHGTMPDGSIYNFSQDVLVSAGDFLYDIPLNVDPETLDPAVTGPEDQTWREVASPATPEKYWNGLFALPVEPVFAECYASRFGSRRSYNGSDYKYYHTGLDYCGQVGDPIYASAAGVVVFAGPLTVRGNATMIDHGWGVYSAYLHQSEILVKVGDHVEQGQLIGRVGNTGRVEGPHLHFEILVGTVPVDPLTWMSQEFP